tara:strand:- start:291 stop:401 length:111 start_codon:yes stop_codon:yes gene_type:complete
MEGITDVNLIMEIQILCIAYAMWVIAKHLLNRGNKK